VFLPRRVFAFVMSEKARKYNDQEGFEALSMARKKFSRNEKFHWHDGSGS
jgi:hypothetical protein